MLIIKVCEWNVTKDFFSTPCILVEICGSAKQNKPHENTQIRTESIWNW